jgi:SAM-dependent methyltransferase
MTDMTMEGFAQRQAAQAAAFDAIGTHYDDVFPHKDGQRDLTDRLLAELRPGAAVLDLGCGTGLPTARQLADAGCAVTGVDISPVMIDLARRNVPEATFEVRDAVDVAGLGPFDAVVAYFSLLMLPRETIAGTLRDLRGVLVPGGLLALGMVEADFDDLEVPFLGRPVRVSGWPRAELRRVLTDAGFDVTAEDVRAYEPAAPGTPPEVQLFVLARSV